MTGRAPHRFHIVSIAALALAGALCAPMQGCATRDTTASAAPAAGSSATVEPGVFDPMGVFSERIRRETRRPDKDAQRAPLPPGLEGAALGPIAGDDALERARLPLDETLARVAEHFPVPPAYDDLEIPEADSLRAVTLFARGRSLRLDGRPGEAIAALEEAARLDPDAAAPWREIGEAQLDLGDRHAARIAFARAFDRNPDDPRVLEQVATLPGSSFSDEQTAAILARLLASDSPSLDPALEYLIPARLGEALLNLGYTDAGVEMLTRAIDLPDRFGEPSNRGAELAALYRRRGDIWVTIGDAHARSGAFERALAAYTRATEFPSLNPQGLLERRIYAAMRLGRPATASAFALQALADADARADAALLATLGYVAKHSDMTGEIDDAILALEASLPEGARRLAAAPIVRARAAVLPPEKAVRMYAAYVARHPEDTVALTGFFTELNAQSPETALREAVRLVGQAPLQNATFVAALLRSVPDPPALLDAWDALDEGVRATPEARLVRARLHAAANQPIQADADLRALLSDAPGYTPAIIARVQLLEMLERLDEADALLAALDPQGDADLAYAKASAMATRPDHLAQAGALVETTLAQTPASHPRRGALLLLGARIAEAREEPVEAERYLEEALALDPSSEAAHELLIMLYATSGALADSEKFVDQLAALREINPSSRILRTMRANEALARGQFDVAERALIELTDQYPDDVRAVDALVTLWLRTGASDRAERWLTQRVERYPASTIYQIKLAETLAAQGRFREAADRLEGWLRQYPGDVVASRLLEQLYATRLDDTSTAFKLELRRLDRTGDPGATAARRARLMFELSDFERLPEVVRLAIDHARENNENLVQWGGQLCGDIYQQVAITGPCPPEVGFECLAAICDGVDGLSETCHEARLIVTGRVPSPGEAMCLGAIDRYVEQHPGKRLHASRLLAVFLNNPFVLVDPSTQTEGDARSRRQRQVTEDEHAARTGIAAQIAVEGLERANLDERERAAYVALGFRALRSGFAVGLERVRHSQRLLDELRSFPNRRTLVEELQNYDRERTKTPLDESDLAVEVGSFFEALDDRKTADAFDELALEFAPDDAALLNNYAYRLLERNDPAVLDRATGMLERAYELSGANPPSHIVDSLGWARYKGGVIHDVMAPDGSVAIEGAATVLSRALSLSKQPNNEDGPFEVPIVADHAGDALWLAGRREEAIEHWRTTVRMGGETLEDDRFAPFLASDLFAELRRSVENAQAKIDAATADRTPPLAPMMRPVNAPGGVADPEAGGDREPDRPTARDKMNEPAPTGDPG